MSTYTVAMAITGVLRTQRGLPIPEGIMMYRCLKEHMNVVLLGDPEMDMMEWDQFQLTESLDASHLEPWPTEGLDDEGLMRLSQVTKIRLVGYAMAFVVEPDPHSCAILLQNGYSTILFSHAEYSYPDWRPDGKITPLPWNELSQQVADNARARAADNRVEKIRRQQIHEF